MAIRRQGRLSPATWSSLGDSSHWQKSTSMLLMQMRFMICFIDTRTFLVQARCTVCFKTSCQIFHMSIDVDFVRTAELLEIYGPCISTASWADWPRHRKVIASPFNEGNMKYVWDESLKQARQMLEIWASESTQQVSSFSEDTRILSLNVLAAMGFRQSYGVP